MSDPIKVSPERVVEEVREACAKAVAEVTRKHIKDFDHEFDRYAHQQHCLRNLGSEIAERIRSLEFEVEEGWISVEERLPKLRKGWVDGAAKFSESEPVLIAGRRGMYVAICVKCVKGSATFEAESVTWHCGDDCPDGVTHWRPLPAPPSSGKAGARAEEVKRG